jgi:beta-glucanase (GH16 family)
MLRFSLLLATVSAVVLLTGWPGGLIDGGAQRGQLVSTTGTSAPNPLARPAVRILAAPTQLLLDEPGTVRIQATAPAVPGARIVLVTAGTYGLGYNKVSESVLDDDLQATLPVAGRPYLGSYSYWATVPASGTYQEVTSATFPIAIVAAAPPAAPTCGGESPAKTDGSAWVCTYNDEFEGDRLDRGFWYPQVTATSGFTTGTRSRYACAVNSPETIAVTGGNLELSLVELPEVRRCGRGKSSKYAFGQVMHFQTFSQTYGKYEVRAKLPDVTVPGVQQSFWLWPKKNKYGSWPASGEIDFAEIYSSTPGIDRPYLHYLPGATAAGTAKNVTTARCPIKVGEFNTYGVEWQPGRITVLLNGEVCLVNDYSSVTAAFQGRYAPFDHPFYLNLNQAMGAAGNEYDTTLVPDRVTTQVDYVRIWK